MRVLALWQNVGIGFGLLFMALVVMQKAFDRCARPFDPRDRMDHRLHFDRQPRDTIGKVTFDPIADEQLRRVQERRRRFVPDNGLRRRRTDRRA